jgi:hypothetical protein
MGGYLLIVRFEFLANSSIEVMFFPFELRSELVIKAC